MNTHAAYENSKKDQRVELCRHSRLRAALQYRQPTEAKTSVETQELVMLQDDGFPVFSPWEQAAARLVKGMLTMVVGAVSFVAQPRF